MERLTEKLTDKSYCISDIRTIRKECFYEDMECRHGVSLYTGKAIDKLAEYEGLEEQGKLPKLPCVVGKTVYELSHGMLPLRVDSFEIGIDGIYANLVSDVYGYKYLKLCVCVVNFGKTVFLTREEAEAALKELCRTAE